MGEQMEMEVTLYDETYIINRIETNRYSADNTLAIQLYCIDKEYGFEEPFATLTVCTDLKSDDYYDIEFMDDLLSRDNISYLDTNNCPWGEEFVAKYKLGKPNGICWMSGYCIYPMYEWDLKELKKYERR